MSTAIPSASVAALSRRPVVTFVDWDDSILPSTWLANIGRRSASTTQEDAAAVSQLLYSLEHSVIRLLHNLLLLGSVCIVTNAQTGWVEVSCAKFLPNVLPWLQKTKIVSARSKYEHASSHPLQWKLLAFRDELASSLEDDGGVVYDLGLNIISFGDSAYERDAMRALAADDLAHQHPACLVKTIKLMERPDITELHSQLEILVSCMSDVASFDGHLDLCLAPRQQQQQQQPQPQAQSACAVAADC